VLEEIFGIGDAADFGGIPKILDQVTLSFA
jgi:hypothetical protein